MTVSATARTPRARPSQPTTTGGPPVAPAAARPAGERRSGRRAERRGRPTASPVATRRRTADAPSTPEARRRREVRRPPGSAPVRRGRGHDRAGDRVLGGGLDRGGQAQHLVAARRRPATTSTSDIRPVVTVPVLSSTTVSTRAGGLEHLGPLIRMPSWAPRPVPTISAVGVARPRAQGQAMTRTATAAVNGRRRRRRRRSQPTQREQRDHQHDRHEDRRDPVGEPLHLRPCRSAPPRPAGRSARAGCRRRRGWRGRPAGRRR